MKIYLGHIARKRWETDSDWLMKVNKHRRALKESFKGKGTIGCRNGETSAIFFLRRKDENPL